jgi:hypothetical protein
MENHACTVAALKPITTQQEFVVERADRVEQRADDEPADPFVAAKIESLGAAGERQADKRPQRGQDARELQQRGTLTEQEKRADQRPHRAGGADRRGD